MKLSERGLELETDRKDHFALAILRADLLRQLGDPSAAMDVYKHAIGLCDDDAERGRTWIGVASCVRLLGGHEEGMEALEKAETAARSVGADDQLAQVHFYRGSLLFGQGEIDRCLEEQRRGLEYAERAEDVELQARALSGLGDALYARGLIASALGYFRQCIALCQEHGLVRIEVPNRYIIGVTRRYMNDFAGAFEDVLAAAQLASKIKNRRAEMYAKMLVGEFLIERGEPDRAAAPLGKSLDIAKSMGNKRFQAYVMNQQARGFLSLDERRNARKLLEEALAISRETGATFIGPRLFGTAALAAENNLERSEALREGEAIVRRGCNAHNVIWFYRDAIDACLDTEDWDGADRYAAALEAYTRPEPLPWSDLFVARGRALAAYGRGKRDDATLAELQRLRDEADRAGLKAAVPALNAALGAG